MPAYSPHAVAEHTVGLILALNRHLHRAYNRVRESNFALAGLLGFDLHERTVGVIGTGAIGSVFAHIMTGFGCTVVAADPHPNQSCRDLGVGYLERDVFARLLTFPNVLITGHQAFFTVDALERIASTTIANLTAAEHGPAHRRQRGPLSSVRVAAANRTQEHLRKGRRQDHWLLVPAPSPGGSGVAVAVMVGVGVLVAVAGSLPASRYRIASRMVTTKLWRQYCSRSACCYVLHARR